MGSVLPWQRNHWPFRWTTATVLITQHHAHTHARTHTEPPFPNLNRTFPHGNHVCFLATAADFCAGGYQCVCVCVCCFIIHCSALSPTGTADRGIRAVWAACNRQQAAWEEKVAMFSSLLTNTHSSKSIVSASPHTHTHTLVKFFWENDEIHPPRVAFLLPRRSPFSPFAWLIVLSPFCQQKIPQETTVIKKCWCWIHIFAFPKCSLTDWGCSRSSTHGGSWRRTHMLFVGLSWRFCARRFVRTWFTVL